LEDLAAYKLSSEGGGSKVLWNVGILPQRYMASTIQRTSPWIGVVVPCYRNMTSPFVVG